MNMFKEFRVCGFAPLAVMLLVPMFLVADQPVSNMSISVNPTSIAPGESAAVTATILPNTGAISCGTGKIEYNINNTGWENLADGLTPSSNQFSATFNTATKTVVAGDTVSFRAGYASNGNGCNFDNEPIGLSPTEDLRIVNPSATACPDNQSTGVRVTIEGPNGNGMPAPGYTGSWSFIVKVRACESLDFASAQGGANGWASFDLGNTVASTGTIQPSYKNRVSATQTPS
jgi:hypothetical protein